MTDLLTAELGSLASREGAAGFGVARVVTFGRERLAIGSGKISGRSGPLGFTFDDPDLATDITISFPWARSVVVVGWSYLGTASGPASEGALVGRFATTDQYREVRRITSALVALLRSAGHRAEALTDDNRLADRAPAIRAGVGWRGRSTMTLIPGAGPWALLGSVVTDAPLDQTDPMQRTCGTCVACLPACPTGALDEEGLDARRCLSTWLQTAGSIPHWIRPLLGRRIYGCDDCLTACPPGHPALQAAAAPASSLPFDELLALEDDDLLDRFTWWYVPHRQGRYLRRNLLIAAGNSGEMAAIDSIRAHMSHPSSMIRSHSFWALARSIGPEALPSLHEALDSERAPESREELHLAIMMTRDPATYRQILGADEWARADSQTRALGVIGSTGPNRTLINPVILLVGEDESGELPELAMQVARATPEELSGLAARVDQLVRVSDPDRLLDELSRELRQKQTPQV